MAAGETEPGVDPAIARLQALIRIATVATGVRPGGSSSITDTSRSA